MVKLLQLNFSFSKKSYIPESILTVMSQLTSKPEPEKPRRKERGLQLLEPSENTTIESFIQELKGLKYKMVDMVFKEGDYYSVSFFFTDSDENSSKEFRQVRETLWEALVKIVAEGFWKAQGWCNKYHENDQPISGQSFVSLMLGTRQPRLESNGDLKIVCQKVNGRKRKDLDRIPVPPSGKLTWDIISQQSSAIQDYWQSQEKVAV